MLTDRQINSIHKQDFETLEQILHECAEALGLVSVREYCEIMETKKRSVYQNIKDKKIKAIDICEHKYPCINY